MNSKLRMVIALALLLAGVALAQVDSTLMDTTLLTSPARWSWVEAAVTIISGLAAAFAYVVRGFGASNWKELVTARTFWTGLSLLVLPILVACKVHVDPRLAGLIVVLATWITSAALKRRVNVMDTLLAILGGTARFAQPDSDETPAVKQ
jgi:hypothetical protein